MLGLHWRVCSGVSPFWRQVRGPQTEGLKEVSPPRWASWPLAAQPLSSKPKFSAPGFPIPLFFSFGDISSRYSITFCFSETERGKQNSSHLQPAPFSHLWEGSTGQASSLLSVGLRKSQSTGSEVPLTSTHPLCARDKITASSQGLKVLERKLCLYQTCTDTFFLLLFSKQGYNSYSYSIYILSAALSYQR